MKLSFWQRWRSWGRTTRRGRPVSRRRPSLEVWQLEERTLLSGTPHLLADINPGSSSSNPGPFLVVGSEAYFAANDGTHGRALWKTDGTTAGTVMLADISPWNLTNVNGELFFSVDNGPNDQQLWKSDGTAAGTVKLTDLSPGSEGPYYGLNVLTNANGTLFFRANDGTRGAELWKSDGTAAGTVMVKDINPGGGSSYPNGLTNVNGTVYFSANDGVHGYELWKSDGTAAGTVLVKDINPGSAWSTRPGLFQAANFNGTLYFNATPDSSPYGLWKSDGTDAGTVPVKVGLSSNEYFTNVDGTLYFSANGGDLWKSDGTDAGTVLVKEFNSFYDTYGGGIVSYPSHLTNLNGTLYFSAIDITHGRELWKSDGTTAGTVMVKDIEPGANIFGFGYGSNPNGLTNVNGKLYFSAYDGVHGDELWQSDGTAAGTTLVQDIDPGPNGSAPYYLTNLNGTLLFAANDGVHGTEPWVLAPTPSLAVSGFPATVTAGTAGSITVTAENADGSTDTSYLGTVHFTSGDPRKSLPANYTFTAADHGVHTFSATLRTAGTQTIGVADTVTASLQGAQTGIVVTPSVVTHFNVALFPSPEQAGVTAAFRVIARDAYNNTVPTYTGTVHFTTSDPAKGVRLPVNYTFISADKGIHTFHATLFTAGTQSLTATDIATSSIAGTQTGIVITPAAVNHFRVYGFPNPTTSGAAHGFIVQAKDLYGNIVTGYTGTVSFSSSDSQATLPAPYTFTSGDAGVHTFSGTLVAVGTQTLTATDTVSPSITGAQTGIVVQAAAAAQVSGRGADGRPAQVRPLPYSGLLGTELSVLAAGIPALPTNSAAGFPAFGALLTGSGSPSPSIPTASELGALDDLLARPSRDMSALHRVATDQLFDLDGGVGEVFAPSATPGRHFRAAAWFDQPSSAV
jgi:ELWxxDGT repeat protein